MLNRRQFMAYLGMTTVGLATGGLAVRRYRSGTRRLTATEVRASMQRLEAECKPQQQSITSAFVKQFEDQMMKLAQQKASRLTRAVQVHS